jgi:hypothetical protein|tara:strand:+ start:285 stop:491 length:207 start_codon:yes stop_codon:yes gene_type:complete
MIHDDDYFLEDWPNHQRFDLLYWTYWQQADKDMSMAIDLIKADILLHEEAEDYEICARLKNILEDIDE